MGYVRYTIKRLLVTVPTLIGATFIIFGLIYLAPGDPAQVMAGLDASQELVERIRADLGLNDPFYMRYGRWLGGVVQGDFGTSYMIKGGTSISTLLATRLPVTLELAALSFLFATLIGVPAGILSATNRNTLPDHLIRVASLTGVSVPYWWTGLMAILVFGVYLEFPWATGGYVTPGTSLVGNLQQMLLPAAVLGFAYAGIIARMTRASMLESLSQEYVRVARAMGIDRNVIVYKDAVQNALIPVVTIMGISIGLLLRGSVLTETVFSLPGLGRLIIQAAFKRDFPVLQASILVVTLLFILSNLVVDLLYGLLDPKLRD